MYSKKSQSELIENKDYNMVLLLPHNATKIIYFSKSFSIRFFLLVIKEYYVFLKVAANVSPVCAVREPSASYGKKSHTNQCALPASAWTGECAYLHGDSHTVNGLHIHSVLRSFILYKFQ